MKIITLILVCVGLVGLVGCETVPKVDSSTEVDRILAENPDAWLELKQTKVPPKVRNTIPPQYPFELKKTGITGRVMVEFDVTKSGTPTNFKIIQSDHELFSESAVAALQRWTFYPAMVNGKPVNVRRVRMPVSFDIN